MWCPGDHHGRAFLHPLPQVPRASTSLGSARRQSPRLQPAGAARPAARAPPYRPAPSDAQGNHRPSYRRPGRTISLASRCRKVKLRVLADAAEPDASGMVCQVDLCRYINFVFCCPDQVVSSPKCFNQFRAVATRKNDLPGTAVNSSFEAARSKRLQFSQKR